MREDYYRRPGDLFFAFVTGVLVGSVAGLMSNPDNREKVRRTFVDVKDKGRQMLADTSRKAHESVEVASHKVKEIADATERAAHEAQVQSRKNNRPASV